MESLVLLYFPDWHPRTSTDRRDFTATYMGWLREDLHELRRRRLAPQLLIVPGNITAQGMRGEFQVAEGFLRGLRDILLLPEDALVVVPGNHDLNLAASAAYFLQCEADETAPREPYAPKLRPYAEFYQRLCGATATRPFLESQPFGLRALPHLRVVVAELNSLIAASHRPQDAYPFLGEDQCNALAGALRPYEEDLGYLRIGVAYHDLLKDCPEPLRAQADRENFCKRLRPHLNLLIHGEGAGFAFEEEEGVLSLGGGGPAAALRYAVVRVDSESVAVGWRLYNEAEKRWEDGPGPTPGGWLHEHSFAPRAVAAAISLAGDAVAARRAEQIDRYRGLLTERLRWPPLYDLGTGDDREPSARLDLLSLFIPQRVRRETPPPLLAAALGEPPISRGTTEGLAAVTDTSEPWVLLLGDPGAGKTALLRYMALRLCTPGESLAPLPSEVVPLYVELRRVADRMRDAPYTDVDGLLDIVSADAQLSVDLLRELAATGRLIWLWDALDEVTEPEARLRCARLIDEVRRRYGGRGVVTSRSNGADLGSLGELPLYTLLAFDSDQVDAFLQRWYRAAFAEARGVGEERQARLRQALQESPSLRALCQNPLMLMLVALINRGGEVPRQRYQVCQRAIELLIRDWEANKHLPGIGRRFDVDSKLRFLRGLAWYLMDRVLGGSGNLIREEDLRAFAVRFCTKEFGEDSSTANRTAEDFLVSLRERSGVLVPVGGGAFGFAHRAFLEYLAAAEVRSRYAGRRWELLQVQQIFLKHWQDRSWMEVLVLVCSLLEDDAATDVVAVLQSVLRDVAVLIDSEWLQFAAFAVRCIAGLRSLHQEKIARFAELLTELIITRTGDSYYLFGGSLRAALRTAGPRWPGAELLQRFTSEDERVRGDELLHTIAARMSLAVTDANAREGMVRTIHQEATPMVAAEIQEEDRALVGAQSDDAVRVKCAPQTIDKLFSSFLLFSMEGGFFPPSRIMDFYQGGGSILAKRLGKTLIEKWESFWPAAVMHRPEGERAVMKEMLWAFAVFLVGFDSIPVEVIVSRLGDESPIGRALLLLKSGRQPEALELLVSHIRENFQRWSAGDEFMRGSTALSFLASLWITEHPDPQSERLFREILHSNVGRELMLLAASLAAYHCRDPELRALGLRRIYEILELTSEIENLHAAFLLRRLRQPELQWGPLLRRRLSNADEVQRLLIARLLSDPQILRDLAVQTTDDNLRHQAATSLEALRLQDILLRVGVPRRGAVFLDGQRAGIIEETRAGARFTYDATYLARPDAEPVSLTMPLRAEPYDSDGLHSAFENLLPEGWYLDITARKLKLDKRDNFGLLLATGKDCIGAIQVFQEQEVVS